VDPEQALGFFCTSGLCVGSDMPLLKLLNENCYLISLWALLGCFGGLLLLIAWILPEHDLLKSFPSSGTCDSQV
jgi:hypothetical protein